MIPIGATPVLQFTMAKKMNDYIYYFELFVYYLENI